MGITFTLLLCVPTANGVQWALRNRSRWAVAIDNAMGPRSKQICIMVVSGLFVAGVVGSWIVRRWNERIHRGTSPLDANSAVDDCDVEPERDDRASAGHHIGSGGATRTPQNHSLHEAANQGRAEASEKSASVLRTAESSSDGSDEKSSLTMGPPNSDTVPLFDVRSIHSSPVISVRNARSRSTWATNYSSDRGQLYQESLESADAIVTAAATLTATGAASLPSYQSGRRHGGGDVSPSSVRAVSLPESKACCGTPSPLALEVYQCSIGAGGNHNGDDEEDDDNIVAKNVLMPGGQDAAPHGDPEYSSPASVAHHAEEEKAGEEQQETDDLNNWVDGASMGSMPELVDQNDPRLAKERTEELLAIHTRDLDITRAVRGIYMTRNCNLDLSTGDNNGHLKRIAVIGTGYYGRVSRVEHTSGVMMALKELTEEASSSHQDAAGNEIDTFLWLGSHPNIPKMLAVDSSLSTMPILMELAHCDMARVISSTKVSMEHKIEILHGAACGLRHMHDTGMVHRDIKPGNIIVTIDETDGSGIGKVADFGLTCDIGATTPSRTGTPGYMPVEFLQTSGEARPDNDVFSFGVVILEMVVLHELRESNMFAHSSLLSAEENTAFAAVADDADGVLDLQYKVMARTLQDGSFAKGILQPKNLQPSVPHHDIVCGWLQACLCQPRDRRPDMASVVNMLRCLQEVAATGSAAVVPAAPADAAATAADADAVVDGM